MGDGHKRAIAASEGSLVCAIWRRCSRWASQSRRPARIEGATDLAIEGRDMLPLGKDNKGVAAECFAGSRGTSGGRTQLPAEV
mmetsp:Transcript_17578/g.47558  ORF Transcript_17578/g.47558 Transcript_17578/m.47558 type:complete len:83 (+) Transcript_17578:998-1246(+)